RVALAWCQLLLVLAVLCAALMLAKALPYWPINPSLAPSPTFVFQVDLARVVWTVLPAACLWGASFPLALAAAATHGQDPARLVSRVYAANTVGAIVGALGFSLIVIPAWGTQHAQQILIALSALAAAVLFGAGLVAPRGAKSAEGAEPISTGVVVGSLGATAALAAFAIVVTPAVPGLLVAYGRYMVTWLNQVDVKYVGEGMNSSVAVTTLNSSGATQF